MNTMDSPYFNFEKFAKRMCAENFPRAISHLEETVLNSATQVDDKKQISKNKINCVGVLNTDDFFLDSREIYD
ncbi:hypothetical protein [Acinetobacter pittii]|uniref:hypothetical protein n=1 Tax=Acinetobacter pittii TaxID=48296 RepID=UPI00132FCD91|nr:hypothetical protein [Acinetobacter pittii]